MVLCSNFFYHGIKEAKESEADAFEILLSFS